MLKVSLFALFMTAMGTLTLAAASMPVEAEAIVVVSELAE